MVKKILAPLLLLVFLIHILGYYIIFEVNRYLIRKEVAASMTGSLKVTVIESVDPLSDPEIRWVDKREFVHKGKLYDIVYTSIGKTKTIFYCIHDIKEERLVKDFRKANSSKITQSLRSLLFSPAIPAPALVLGSTPSIDVCYPKFNTRVTSLLLAPESPPPKG